MGEITKDSETGVNADVNINQHQKLQQRSLLHKFEQDYMNPIFGGPDPVSNSSCFNYPCISVIDYIYLYINMYIYMYT
jgi:hypothetical protein